MQLGLVGILARDTMNDKRKKIMCINYTVLYFPNVIIISLRFNNFWHKWQIKHIMVPSQPILDNTARYLKTFITF